MTPGKVPRKAIVAYAKRFGMEVKSVEYELIGLDPELATQDLVTFKPLGRWHPFEEQRLVYRSRSIKTLEPPANLVKGLRVCKCGNDVFVFTQMQLRSRDEGMTAFWYCTKCKKVKKES